jgi:hypothetical protein
MQQSGAIAHCGAGSLALPFAATTARNAIDCMNPNFAPTVDLSGSAVTCWVYIAAPAPPSGTVAVQICAQGSTFSCAGWTDNLPVNTWTQVIQTFAAGTTNVVHLNVQVVWNNPGASQTWNGTVNLDDICVK